MHSFSRANSRSRWKMKNKSNCNRNHVHSASGNEVKYRHQFHFFAIKRLFFRARAKKFPLLQHNYHGKFSQNLQWSCTRCWSSINCYFFVHFPVQCRDTSHRRKLQKGESWQKKIKMIVLFSVSFVVLD